MKKSKDPRYREAMILFAFGDGELAREKLSDCIAEETEAVWIAFFTCKIAESYAQDGELSEALAAIKNAVQIDPSPLSLISYAELALNALRDAKLSLELFSKALTTGRDCWDDPSTYELFRRRTLERIQSLF